MTAGLASSNAEGSVSTEATTIHPLLLIERLLNEQSEPTAVETFSRWHAEIPARQTEAFYRHLLPATGPAPGQQYGFQVDLDRCSGCKACVTACHTLNGLDSGESFRDVGLLLGEDEHGAMFQHITTACHHCLEPGCLSACPVNAYEKDPVTGIVRHLDDQCFGCQYCTLACPYEVPRYHSGKGIVRKCDLCSQRLKAGEAPACVQACPHEAISIALVDIAAVREACANGDSLAGAPDPTITLPATRFVGRAAECDTLTPGNYGVRPLECRHLPLVCMLILSQISVGIVLLTSILLLSEPTLLTPFARTALLATAAALALTAALASTAHLGRPQYAFRALLGMKHSWLSREIAFFGLYIPLSGLCVVLSFIESARLLLALALCCLAGTAGVAASVMVYHITRRPFWSSLRTAPAFAATSLAFGALLCAASLRGQAAAASTWSILLLISAAGAAWKILRLFPLRPAENESLANQCLAESTALMAGRLKHWTMGHRLAGGIAFATALLASATGPATSAAVVRIAIAGLSLLAAEICERMLFFRAVTSLRMPGVSRR